MRSLCAIMMLYLGTFKEIGTHLLAFQCKYVGTVVFFALSCALKILQSF